MEDDHDLLALINILLTHHHFEVLTAVTGAEARSLFAANADGLSSVVLDLTLPDADGEAIARDLRELAPDLPIVITTGMEDAHLQERLTAMGIQACLIKPFDLTHLVDVLTRL